MSEYIELDIPEDKFLQDDGKMFLTEIQLKFEGDIWRIHNNDPDIYFPSDAHADCVSTPGFKLNLYDGKVYNKERKVEKTLSKKQLAYIYTIIKQSKLETIKSKLKIN